MKRKFLFTTLPLLKKPRIFSLTAKKFLTDEEYLRIIRDFSEKPGHCFSSNYSSNESSYLDALSQLEKLNITGGACRGVESERNCAYMALHGKDPSRVRPHRQYTSECPAPASDLPRPFSDF